MAIAKLDSRHSRILHSMYLAFKLAGPPCRRNTADCQLVGRFKTEKWVLILMTSWCFPN